MYPRLKLLRELLDDDGMIFVSIDENEVQNLKLIMNEIFDPQNFIFQLIWKKKYTGGKHASHFVDFHEYIFVYGKNKENIGKFLIDRTEKEKEKFKKTDKNFSKWGKYYDRPFKSNLEERKTLVYPIKLPNGKVISTQWLAGRTVFEEWKKTGKIFFKKLKNGEYNVYEKYYEKEGGGEVMAASIFDDFSDVVVNITESQKKTISKIIEDVQKEKPTEAQLETIIKLMFSEPSIVEGIYNSDAANEIKKIFGLTATREAKKLFANPKPLKLIKKIIKMATKENDLILDSFAGSGTTAQSVLELNKEDGGNRKFILVELEPEICKNITAQRVKKVIKGYEDVPGTGGGFQYAVLDKKLFDSDGRINEDCTFEELASYIFFEETRTILDVKKIQKTLLNTYNDAEYHLIFKGIGKNSLDRKFLVSLDRQKNKVIYADKCALDDSTLEKYNTVFKQIPYEVKEF